MKITQVSMHLVLSLVLLQSCTTKTTKKKDPIFTKHSNTIAKHIHAIQPNEKIEVSGREVNTNGKISSELTINLINPRNPPPDTGKLEKTGAKIAALVKQVIKNPDDYDTYTVLFTTKEETSILVKTNYIGFDYRRDEIKPNIYFVSLGNKLDSFPLSAIGKTSFTSNDSLIYAVILDYNFDPKSQLSSRIFKETHPNEILVAQLKSGLVKDGTEYLITSLKVKPFFKTKQLQSGDYRFEYLVNDSIVGAIPFRLE